MAMMRCPECGNSISSSSPICPNCGYSFLYALPNKRQAKTNLFVFIIGLLLCLLLNSAQFVLLVIAGFVIEVIASFITAIASALFGRRAFRIVYYFIVFDLGFALGIIIKFIFNVIKL